MKLEQFKKLQELNNKVTGMVLINLVNVISLKMLNKYKDTSISEIVKNTSSKLIKQGVK